MNLRVSGFLDALCSALRTPLTSLSPPDISLLSRPVQASASLAAEGFAPGRRHVIEEWLGRCVNFVAQLEETGRESVESASIAEDERLESSGYDSGAGAGAGGWEGLSPNDEAVNSHDFRATVTRLRKTRYKL